MTKRVQVSHFAFRQTAESRFSHFLMDGHSQAASFQHLEELVLEALDNNVNCDGCALSVNHAVRRNLRDDGKIVKLTLPKWMLPGFYSGVVAIDAGMELRSTFAVRENALPGELPFIQTVAVGAAKQPARHVDVILYHRDALTVAERTYQLPWSDDVIVQDGEWHVVSINARLTDGEEPQTPMAMARNMAKLLGMPEGAGGTERRYTPEEFIAAVFYWSQHTTVAPVEGYVMPRDE